MVQFFLTLCSRVSMTRDNHSSFPVVKVWCFPGEILGYFCLGCFQLFFMYCSIHFLLLFFAMDQFVAVASFAAASAFSFPSIP